MGKIRVLPPEVIGHIAAGEVVERPASVAKELVENSLDAGARRVVVAYEGGGIALVRVRDDGEGISAEDLPQVFVRHATSKIARAEDLARVTTLGFRGEALPSIAAVARVRIASRTPYAPVASWIAVEGGEVVGRGEEARAPGTEVVVRDLFFNTPARRKFVRSLVAEGAHLLEVLERLALSRPDVAFAVYGDDRLAFATPGDGILLHAFSSVAGAEAAREMIPVEEARGPWRVWGLVGVPSAARKRMRRMYFNVNGRPVRSFAWQRAVLDGYGTRLLREHRPPFVLFVEGPPERIDPNVHPAKWEVRLAEDDEHLLYGLLRDAVSRALARADRAFAFGELMRGRSGPADAEGPKRKVYPEDLPPEAPEDLPSAARGSSSVAPASSAFRAETSDAGVAGTTGPSGKPASRLRGPFAFLVKGRRLGSEGGASPSGGWEVSSVVGDLTAGGEELPRAREPRGKYDAGLSEVAPPVPLLQLFDTYILAAGEGEYYLVDQHAAQERIRYEKLLRAAADGTPSVHFLVVPWVLERSASEAEALAAQLGALREMGIDISPFGPRRFRVRAVPDWLADEETFLAFLERFLGEGGRLGRLEFLDEFLKDRACKAAIKGNRRLSPEEMSGLLAELFRCSEPYTCPHGRPTIVRIGREDLERLFRRTVF
ncbi:MAG: DNA mismatch repair protein MutL [Brockia lithotrophica]|uniref:DNA mismatch repair protein MutL n=1 Tax=Brockia lithotrophica TaxID=933949 RepID=A0A2T5G8K7_9BACL|nr:MAG: DNA mismatch repair protein MutL [Brockia lithotrophica]